MLLLLLLALYVASRKGDEPYASPEPGVAPKTLIAGDVAGDWIAAFRERGFTNPPPEVPLSMDDVGSRADLSAMEAELLERTYDALFLSDDPGELFVLADELDRHGYRIASNRLKQKAFRLVV